MPQPVILTSSEELALSTLSLRLKAARLRRNLSQEAMAERAGVTRKTYRDLEAGKGSVSLAVFVKAMRVLGYLDRVGDMLASDPIGDGMAVETGRQRAGKRDVLGDF